MHILNFNATAIKRSTDVENEMLRLKSKLLQSVPELKCLALTNNYVTISLFNIRSIIAKLPDIVQDNCLKHANILCFCETWLTPLQPTPVVQNNQVAVRCDRASNDNKGGTMISFPQHMRPCNTDLLLMALNV